MKAWPLIDFKKVAELLDAYEVCVRLANEFQMFDTHNVVQTVSEIREAIRFEVGGEITVNGKG